MRFIIKVVSKTYGLTLNIKAVQFFCL